MATFSVVFAKLNGNIYLGIKHLVMDYVLIKNGKIISDDEVVESDLLIGNNKIVAIGNGLERPEPETPVIDAGGKYLLPGAIDTSISFGELCQVESDIQVRFNQAEVMGGTTAIIETMMPGYSLNATSELINRRNKKFFVVPDYSFHLALQGWEGMTAKDIDYCYSHEGITSFFLQWPLLESYSQAKLDELLQVIAYFDLVIVLEMQQPEIIGYGHPELDVKYKESIDEHLRQFRFIISKIIKYGCRLCLLGLSFKEQLDIIDEFKEYGLITAELVFPYNIGGQDRYEVNEDSIFSGFSLANRLTLIPTDKLWELLHEPHYFLARPLINLSGEGIVKDSQVNNRPDEFFLLKNFLSVVYTAGVVEGNITISEFASIVSGRQSKLFGLYPKKGVLKIGADADIVIWDPDFERNLYCNFPVGMKGESKSIKLHGRPDFVFARGNMVYDGENFTKEGCCGKYLYRSPV
ncbi:hypothetical protein [Carboxylicivirga caseinilyticus]|uniref:hypothetical protein n=1 Tax=Carboxylicivirga caseinilyticus TaxID=3417572 RepID=UPI003D335434|nr:amidohydrolase family protein [Marinilabiliaceae bacterium A049]